MGKNLCENGYESIGILVNIMTIGNNLCENGYESVGILVNIMTMVDSSIMTWVPNFALQIFNLGMS